MRSDEKFMANQDTLIECDQMMYIFLHIFSLVLQCLDPIRKKSHQ